MSSRKRKPREASAQNGATGRRRWLWGGIGAPVLLVAGLWFAPALVAHTALRQKVVSSALADFQGQVSLGAASLGWLSPLAAYDVTAVDSEGRPLAEVKSLQTEKSLLALLSDRSRPGAIRLEQPNLHLELRDRGSNWEDALAAYLSASAQGGAVRAVRVDIVGGSLQVRDAGGNPLWQVRDVNATAEYATATEWPVLVRLSGEIEASPERRGTVAAEFTWRATPAAPAGLGDGQVKVRLENAPLDTLASAARRWLGDLQANGAATGEGLYQWADNGARHNLRIDRLTGRDVALTAPQWLGPDVLGSSVLEARGQIENDGPQWRVRDLSVKTDFADLRAQGVMRADQLARVGSWNTLLDELSQADTRLQGQIDVARLAAVLPSTLRIRAGTEIKSGQLDVSLASRSPDQPGVVARFELANLAAGGRLLADRPIVIGAKLQRTADGPVIDELVCQSDFLNVTAHGTLVQGEAVVHGDLTKLAEQLGQVVELNGLRLSGRLDGDMRWQRRGDEIVTANGEVTLAEFELAAKDALPWREQQLVVTLAATARAAQDRLTRIESASVTLESGQDRLTAELLRPVDRSQGGAAWPIRMRAVGDLATWVPRGKPFFSAGNWRLAGGIDLNATANLGTDKIEADSVKCDLTNLRAAGNGVTIDEPLVQVAAQASWDRATGTLTASSATLASTTVAFRAEQIVLQSQAGRPALSGAVSYRADVARLARWTADPRRPASGRWTGALTGQVDATHTSGVTRLDWSAEVKDLAYSAQAAVRPTAATPLSLPAATSDAWREPLIKLTGLQQYDQQRDVLEIERLTVASTTLGLSANGRVSEASQRRVADIQGQVEYDLKRVTEGLRAYFGSQLELAGTERGQFRLSGPLAGAARTTASDPTGVRALPAGASVAPRTAPLVAPELTANAEAGWSAGKLFGLTVGAGRLQSSLDHGLWKSLPLEIPVGDGRVKLAPQVDLNAPSATLVMPPGPVAENVALSPELCRGWLKFVAPLLADATAAQGRFSLSLDSLAVPLADTNKSDIHGTLIIHTAQVGPGPLAQEFLSVAGQIRSLIGGKTGGGALDRTWLIVPEQNLHFDVQDGRVLHRDFTMQAGDVVIRTTGSVGLDQSLALTAEVPIRDEWVAQRSVLGALKGTTLKIPIGGVIAKPQLDKRALADLNRQVLRNAAGRLLEDEVGRGLDRLLRSRP